MASISESRNHVPAPAYKISKDYPQMLTVQWAKALGDNGFTVVAISLGVSSTCPNLDFPIACFGVCCLCAIVSGPRRTWAARGRPWSSTRLSRLSWSLLSGRTRTTMACSWISSSSGSEARIAADMCRFRRVVGREMPLTCRGLGRVDGDVWNDELVLLTNSVSHAVVG